MKTSQKLWTAIEKPPVKNKLYYIKTQSTTEADSNLQPHNSVLPVSKCLIKIWTPTRILNCTSDMRSLCKEEHDLRDETMEG